MHACLWVMRWGCMHGTEWGSGAGRGVQPGAMQTSVVGLLMGIMGIITRSQMHAVMYA